MMTIIIFTLLSIPCKQKQFQGNGTALCNWRYLSTKYEIKVCMLAPTPEISCPNTGMPNVLLL